MRATKVNDLVKLDFNFLEGCVLQRLLTEVLQNYRLKPEQMDPKAARAWYSTRGCESAGMSAEEAHEWVENLHGFKGANLQRLEDWTQELAKNKAGHHHLQLKLDDAPHLLTALNDHRLLAAARHDIGQAEMDAHSLSELTRLTQAQQTALYEIHFLAYVIEEILRLLPHNCTDWG